MFVSATTNQREMQSFALNPQDRLRIDLYRLCMSTAHDALEKMHSQLSTVYRSSSWHTLYCKDGELILTQTSSVMKGT